MVKERSTITPYRFVSKSKTRIFKIDSEAFVHPNTSEAENLIINLEDIVKEENVIYGIQVNINKHMSLQNF